jgi:aspartyl-tRNA(Asn)/glutamyl-tRNA(Gln) amidotransferase subunit A
MAVSTEHEAVRAMSVRELASRIRAGELGAVDVAEAYLAQIEAVDQHVRAYRLTTPEVAKARAEAVDRARENGETLGLLAGVPMALKDIFVTKGIETTCGSKILEGWIPAYEGTPAARLHAAGAVLLGKLSMDEFAMGSSNENTPYSVVRNPWDARHVPGGSSGGSAAAVAARAAAFSLGTDTGGSIRQPASMCNVVGLKPTYGRVSRYGMIAFASSLDQAGPIARRVRDAAAVLQTIAGADPLDATSVDTEAPEYLAACDRGAKGLRIGVHRDALRLEGLDNDVGTAFEHSLRVLRDGGAELVDVELPHFRHAIATYYVLAAAEASSNLARYDGIRYGSRVSRGTLTETYEATREAGFGPEVKRRIMLGTFVLRKDSYEAYYGRAQRVRTLIARDYERAFECCDVIASPTSPVPAFPIGDRVDDPLAMYLMDVFTIGVNLAGLPGISIPGGFSRATDQRPRLPIGFQLCARRFGEEALLAAAAAHEDATEWHLEIPPGVSG